jgi:hypothetical protein
MPVLFILLAAVLVPPPIDSDNRGSTYPAGRPASRTNIDDLNRAARRVKRGLVLVGHPRRGHGTAFVISRKHRLLATAAHVADHAFEEDGMLAVPEGSTTEYHVVRVWFHPGIVRKLDEGLFARSERPDDGEIAYRVPDVAVIQLSDDGPELPD